MFAPDTEKTATSGLWAYGRDEHPGGSDGPLDSWHQVLPDGRGQHPKGHLARYRGWMHTDEQAGGEDFYGSGDIHESARMTPVRPKLVDIRRAQGPALADEANKRIAQLYIVEAKLRGSPPKRRAAPRQENSRPAFNDLEGWLHAQLSAISSTFRLSGVMHYAPTRMARLRPDLNGSILELETTTAITHTVIETAKPNGIYPHAWWADALARIPDDKINRFR